MALAASQRGLIIAIEFGANIPNLLQILLHTLRLMAHTASEEGEQKRQLLTEVHNLQTRHLKQEFQSQHHVTWLTVFSVHGKIQDTVYNPNSIGRTRKHRQ